MKRYFLFGGDCYYPGGGASDFIGAFDTLDDAIQGWKNCDVVKNTTEEWAHVADQDMVVVCSLNTLHRSYPYDNINSPWMWKEYNSYPNYHKVPIPALLRKEAILFDVLLSADAPKDAVIDWLLEHGREEAAEYLRGT